MESLHQLLYSLLEQQAVVWVPLSDIFFFSFLLHPFPGTQKKWWLETRSRSEETKSLHTSGKIQDGIAANHYPCCPTRGLDAIGRHTGCLLTHIHTSTISEVHEVCSRPDSPAIPKSPFRPWTSPRVFTKVLISVLAPLQEFGLRVYHYLDDVLLLLAKDPIQLVENRKILLSALSNFGWKVNQEKSHLTPIQEMIYLDPLFNTAKGTVSFPPQKGDSYYSKN